MTDGVDENFIIGANHPYGMAVDAGQIYRANYFANSVGRANRDGTGRMTVDAALVRGGTPMVLRSADMPRR